jgi:hypothetical protein
VPAHPATTDNASTTAPEVQPPRSTVPIPIR